MSVRDLIVSIDFDDINIKSLLNIDDAMNEIEDGFKKMGSDIMGASKDFDKLGSSGSDAMKEVTKDADKTEDALDELGDVGKKSGDKIEDAMDDASDEIVDAKKKTDDLGDELDDTGKRGTKAGGAMVSAFKSVAVSLAAIFAFDKMKDLGVSMVEAAGEAEAMDAQFTQIFGKMEGTAQDTLNDLGKEFGTLPTRLKPTFTSVTSMFKGFGMSTKDSMKAASTSTTLAADAAAFYDISLDDAAGSLTSFLKGNTNAAESIGVFATAAGMADFASKELGKDWKKLDEGGKQLVRLKYVEKMQAAAGATGQAARESDGLENVLGNLRQSWTDLQAKLGVPLLEKAIPVMQKFADIMSNIDTDKIIGGFKAFGGYMSDTFGPILGLLKDEFNSLKDSLQSKIKIGDTSKILDGLKDGMQWIVDNWKGVKDGVLALGAAVLTFKGIMGGMAVIGTVTGLIKSYRAGTLLATNATLANNLAMLASPWTWVAVGVAALVAVGVLLYRNWDTVKAKALELWDSFLVLKDKGVEALKEKFGEFGDKLIEIKDGAIQYVHDKIDAFIDVLKENKDNITAVATALGIVFGPALVKTGIQAAVAGAKITVSFIGSLIATSAQAVRTGAVTTASFIGSMIRTSAQAVVTGSTVTASFIASMVATSAQAIRTGAVITAQFIATLVKSSAQALVTASVMTGSLIVSMVNFAVQGWRAAASIAAQTAAFVIQKGAMITSAVVTGTMTAAQWALNVAMSANPIGLIILGIAALIGVGILLYQNWETVKNKALDLWAAIRENPLLALAAGPIGAVIAAGVALYNNWDTVKATAISLWQTATEKFNSMKTNILTALQPVLDFFGSLMSKWDDFKSSISNFKMPSIKMPGWVGKVGSFLSGSHATGLERVPYDGYVAELHKDEAVLTATQSDALRAAGILTRNGDKPQLRMDEGQSPANISGDEISRTSNNQKTVNTFAPHFDITIEGGGSNADEIEAKTRKVVREETERFWKKMQIVTE